MTHGPGSRRAAVLTAIGAGYRASARTMLAMTSACGAGSTSGRSAWNGHTHRRLLLFGSVPPAQRPDFSGEIARIVPRTFLDFTVHRAPTVRGRHVRGIPVHPDPQAARRGGYRLPVRGGHRRQPRRRVHARHRAPPLVAPGCTGRSEGMQTRLADTRGTGRRGRRDVVRGEPRRAVRGAHKRRGGDPTV